MMLPEVELIARIDGEDFEIRPYRARPDELHVKVCADLGTRVITVPIHRIVADLLAAVALAAEMIGETRRR